MMTITKCKLLNIILFCIAFNSTYAESLFDPKIYSGIVNDKKAFKVGDSLTVAIIETSSASSSSDIETNRTVGITANANNSLTSGNIGLGAGAEMGNGGEVNRDGKLLANVTVTVHEVLPTGELRIKGNQYIVINEEEQIITLSGNVRPEDIGSENVVLSTRIANANILYSGDGVVGGKPGVITRFFKWLF